MNMRSLLSLTSLCTAVMISGCANPGIVKLSADTYMLSRTDKGGVFGNASAMKANVIREASDFAEKQGKVAVPVSLNESPMYIGHFASVDYQFRIVDPSSPEAQGGKLIPRPDVVIEKTEAKTVDVQIKGEAVERPKDVYSELLKLDDLHKRGILNQDEFEAQKKKLLGNR